MKLPDYQNFYNYYRKLPTICSILLGILVFVWSIVDVSLFSYTSRYYGSSYGIMGLDSVAIVLFIWWAIGAVLCVLTYFFMSLAISPTIVQTDAVLEINKKLDKE